MNQGAHGLVNDVWTSLEEQVVGSNFTQTPISALARGITLPVSLKGSLECWSVVLVSGDSLVELF